MTLLNDLERLLPEMVVAAQEIIDEWTQDEEGIDEVLGTGGVCDEIASAILYVLDKNIDVKATFGAPEGEDHEWVYQNRQ